MATVEITTNKVPVTTYVDETLYTFVFSQGEAQFLRNLIGHTSLHIPNACSVHHALVKTGLRLELGKLSGLIQKQ